MKFTTKPLNNFHHTLTMFLHYLGKFNSSNLLQFTTEKSKSVSFSYLTKMKRLCCHTLNGDRRIVFYSICQKYFGFLPVSHRIDICTVRFLDRFKAIENT